MPAEIFFDARDVVGASIIWLGERKASGVRPCIGAEPANLSSSDCRTMIR